MKYKTAISIIVASILAVTSMSSFAGQGQRGSAGADRAQQVDRDRTYDRDRMQDRSRIDVPNQDQDRDRDRIHMQDPSKIKDQDIYGNDLMTDAERNQFRKELGNADTQGSRMGFQAQHEERMQERALKQGQDLVPPGQGPIYGGEFMSVQERNEYREQLRLHNLEKERQQFQALHRDQMNERARALGREIEEAE